MTTLFRVLIRQPNIFVGGPLSDKKIKLTRLRFFTGEVSLDHIPGQGTYGLAPHHISGSVCKYIGLT